MAGDAIVDVVPSEAAADVDTASGGGGGPEGGAGGIL